MAPKIGQQLPMNFAISSNSRKGQGNNADKGSLALI
jgi:hypothetical protein